MALTGRPRGSPTRLKQALELTRNAHTMFREAAIVPDGTGLYSFDGTEEARTPAVAKG